MTAKLVSRIHTGWVVLGLFCWPVVAGFVRPQQILAAMIVQSLTTVIWITAGAKYICPLRALEFALRDGEPINKWWIVQPIATLMFAVIFCEGVWWLATWRIH